MVAWGWSAELKRENRECPTSPPAPREPTPTSLAQGLPRCLAKELASGTAAKERFQPAKSPRLAGSVPRYAWSYLLRPGNLAMQSHFSFSSFSVARRAVAVMIPRKRDRAIVNCCVSSAFRWTALAAQALLAVLQASMVVAICCLRPLILQWDSLPHCYLTIN